MLSQKLFRWVNKVALFAIIFTSLAPSISHALQANSGAGFVQEVCTTNGEKITIQVLTTQGKELATEFNAQTSNDKAPAGIQHHLQHCPFCNASLADNVIPSCNPAFALYLAHQVDQQLFEYQPPVVPTTIQCAHQSRAPPSISL